MDADRAYRRSRRNLALVREVLMREWDPIGIAGEPAAMDEYDTYALKAALMVVEGNASAEALAAYLMLVATVLMEFPRTDELAARSERTAAALVALRPTLAAD
ncbi:MAG TPA: hypothetical protein VMC10_19200 [Stellaceae bacterium]|nr:hypothetical protein [Stellaceae bacterium]